MNAKTYFVKGIKIDQKTIGVNDATRRIYFRNLKKINNKIPEVFKDEPFISVLSLGSGIFEVIKVNREYFDYNFSGYVDASDIFVLKIDTAIHNKSKINNEGEIKETKPIIEATTFDLIIIEGVNQ